MTITVNGEPLEVEGAITVSQLLDRLQVRRELVAVEVNRRVVRRAEQEATPIAAGDSVEIVSFVGGG